MHRGLVTVAEYLKLRIATSATGGLANVVDVERGELGAAVDVAVKSDPAVGAGRGRLTGAGSARQVRPVADHGLRIPTRGTGEVPVLTMQAEKPCGTSPLQISSRQLVGTLH